MATSYTHITEQLDEAIGEITAELEMLEEARQHLIGEVTPRKRGEHQPKTAPKTTSRERGEHTAKVTTKKGKKHSKPERGERKAQIRELLAEGMTPHAIADQLGTHVNYVYLTQRQDREAIAEAKAKRGTRRFSELDSGLRTKQPVKAAKAKAQK